MCKKHIKHNKARCNGCLEIIESLHRHHLKSCRCGDTFVDGGTAYVRIGFKDEVGFERLTEYDEECDCDVREQDCAA